MNTRWTRVDELVATLRKRWDTGRYLRDHADDIPWRPVTLPVRAAPRSSDVADDLEAVRRWEQRFRHDSLDRNGRPRFTIETRTIRGHGLGTNEIPARIRIETFDQLCTLLGTAGEVAQFDEIVDHTRRTAPALLPWIRTNPLAAIALRDEWTLLVDTVEWIAERDTSSLYLRQVDVAGVDTKFIERHQKVLGRLLAATLPPERIDPAQPTFARRYGFRDKPTYTRLRLLGPTPPFPSCVSELRLRTDELAVIDVPIRTVFVVENEVSYLAFPAVRDAIVIFGEGFHVRTLASLPWLHDKEIVYWGDIDTHGFVMLNDLRAGFPTVRSILMDHETLLAHPDQWVTEPSPTTVALDHLTDEERSLYHDLIEDRFGPAVRLEQERTRFSLVAEALEPWIATVGTDSTRTPDPSPVTDPTRRAEP